jgi:hypothetical protein
MDCFRAGHYRVLFGIFVEQEYFYKVSIFKFR